MSLEHTDLNYNEHELSQVMNEMRSFDGKAFLYAYLDGTKIDALRRA